MLESARRADDRNHVPFELLECATVTDSVPQDEIVTGDDVVLEETFVRALREDPDEASP